LVEGIIAVISIPLDPYNVAVIGSYDRLLGRDATFKFRLAFSMNHKTIDCCRLIRCCRSISVQECDVSRMYVAVKFHKIKESQIEVGDEDVGPDEMIDPN
jgi:hypothetical protein